MNSRKNLLVGRYYRHRNCVTRAIYLAILGLVLAPLNQAFAFDSGSTGADGALDFSGLPSGTVVDFDPSTFSPALDQDGDSVYHFTTINIPPGVTVRLRSDKAGVAPIHWLATGAVSIGGEIDLSGGAGHDADPNATRSLSVPGPGGFAGGIGSRIPGTSATAGNGPGGGSTCTFASQGASGGSYATLGGNFRFCASSSPTYGSAFLLPLLGGSGGGGGGYLGVNGSGGGAGGGAILIASTISIIIDGSVRADGGAPIGNTTYNGGCGSGGAIRLVAPVVGGAGALSTSGSVNCPWHVGGLGRLRIEATEKNFSGTIVGDARTVTLVPNPVLVDTSVGFPLIRVAAIGGQAVPARPLASFAAPDINLDAATDVQIDLQGQNIPVGTTVEVTVSNETEGLTTVESSPLIGTLESSTVSVTVRIPPGYSRIFTHAEWQPQP